MIVGFDRECKVGTVVCGGRFTAQDRTVHPNVPFFIIRPATREEWEAEWLQFNPPHTPPPGYHYYEVTTD